MVTFTAQVEQRLTWWAEDRDYHDKSILGCVVSIGSVGQNHSPNREKGTRRHKGLQSFIIVLWSVCAWERWRRVGRAQSIASLIFLASLGIEDPVLVLCSGSGARTGCLGSSLSSAPSEQWLSAHEPPFHTTASSSIKSINKKCKSFSGLLEELDKLKHLNQSDYSWHIVNAQ